MSTNKVGKHVKTIVAGTMKAAMAPSRACGECQSSCQSACKTSCTVGNQACQQS